MGEYLVELYVSRLDGAAVEGDAERALAAAQELSREGRPVRYVRSIFVPEDETCFLLYEADSVEAVREAVERAGVAVERIAEAAAQPTREEPCRCP